MFTLNIPIDEILKCLFVAVRLSGLFLFGPFWSNSAIPRQLKILLIMMTSIAVFSSIEDRLALPPLETAGFVLAIARELIVGAAIGFVGRIVFAGFEMAGHLMGFQIGFSVASIIDPQSRVNSSVMTIFFGLLAMLFFLSINGHHWFFQSVIASYHVIPIGQASVSGSVVELLIKLSGRLFIWGLQLAAPVVAVLIIVDLVMGIISRAAPQMQVLVMSFPLKSLVGVWALSASLYFFPNAIEKLLLNLQQQIIELLQSL